jgi:hypothetical protein
MFWKVADGCGMKGGDCVLQLALDKSAYGCVSVVRTCRSECLYGMVLPIWYASSCFAAGCW